MKTLLVVILIAALGLFGCNSKQQNIDRHAQSDLISKSSDGRFFIPEDKLSDNTNSLWHYDGQVLYPDYAHQDTVVVIRANYMNRLFASSAYDGSDMAISDILHATCEPLNGRVLDLPEEYESNNHLDDLSTIIKKDSIIIAFQ